MYLQSLFFYFNLFLIFFHFSFLLFVSRFRYKFNSRFSISRSSWLYKDSLLKKDERNSRQVDPYDHCDQRRRWQMSRINSHKSVAVKKKENIRKNIARIKTVDIYMCLYTKVHDERWKSARSSTGNSCSNTRRRNISRRATRDRNCGGKTKETEETHAFPRAWSPCICNRHLQIKTVNVPSVPMKIVYIHLLLK